MKQRYCNDFSFQSLHVRRHYVWVHIYYEDVAYTEIKQVEAYDLVALLGEILNISIKCLNLSFVSILTRSKQERIKPFILSWSKVKLAMLASERNTIFIEEML